MTGEELIELYSLLHERGVQVWIGGGWGIDALVGTQSRYHKDFDAFVAFDDLATTVDVLAERGFTLKEIWSENRWVDYAGPVKLIGMEDATGHKIATAFVLWHTNGQELDFHALTFDDAGDALPAWDDATVYPAEAFTGQGTIVNTPVRCLSATIQMATHTGYTLTKKDLQDLRLLHDHCGTPFLAEQAPYFL